MKDKLSRFSHFYGPLSESPYEPEDNGENGLTFREIIDMTFHKVEQVAVQGQIHRILAMEQKLDILEAELTDFLETRV